MRSATARRRLAAALAVSAALPARAYALPPAALDNPGQLSPGGVPNNLLPPTVPQPGTEAPPATSTEPGAPAVPVPPTAHALQPTSTLPEPAGGLRIQPSIGVQEYFTDNVFQTPKKTSDFITGITPGLSVRDDTARVQAAAEYNPTGLIYARNPSQDRINQNFSGQATITLVPDTLFLDARGYVTTAATNGGFAPGGTPLLSRNQSSTVTSFTVSPYAVHRFGDIGTGEIGVTLGTTNTSGGQINGVNGFNAFGAPIQGNPNGDTRSIEETAQFTTGAILPRLQDRTLFDASQQTGSVLTQRSTQFLATNRVEYALNRQIALIGEIGYENLRFEGIPPLRISDMVWHVGARWDPNPDSSITATYGHQNGFNSAFVSGYYALTARTTLYATYATGLLTDQQQIQNNLDLAAIDPYGNLVNSETLAPLFVSNNLIGLNNNLNRVRTLTVNAVTAFDRDTVSLYVFSQQQTPVAVATVGQVAQKLTGVSGGATWTHALSEVSSTSLHADYGTSSGTGGFLGVTSPDNNQAIFDVSATLTHEFTPTLSGVAEYLYTHRTSNISGQGFVQNLFLVGVQKTF